MEWNELRESVQLENGQNGHGDYEQQENELRFRHQNTLYFTMGRSGMRKNLSRSCQSPLRMIKRAVWSLLCGR